jgi:hypothetical protein
LAIPVRVTAVECGMVYKIELLVPGPERRFRLLVVVAVPFAIRVDP